MAETIETFQSQLSGVMETVFKAAMYEITRLVEDSFLEEVTRCRDQVDSLKRRLKWSEGRRKDREGDGTGRCVDCGRVSEEEGSRAAENDISGLPGPSKRFSDQKIPKCHVNWDAGFVQRPESGQHGHSGDPSEPLFQSRYGMEDLGGFNKTAYSDASMIEMGNLGDKPYCCTVCGNKFSRLWNLKLHRRIHTQEKPHQCTMCDKSFTRADILKVHQRTHTGERPYCCAVCGLSFKRLDHLKSHQRKHMSDL
ncbi:hypothetical protein F2P81_010858 [Scophthalmus maximus]|uniref:C2H2-type domain-containing protein n=1 Tax=Scophthalmus maximus TaxID=52904 RepID=A0A6A4T429_SCOMX|nr:hypothetical protein F2P81_010858 [Scophthalmus maximus]